MELTEAAHVLGVAADASPAEVRRAYRRLLLIQHPDQAGPGDGVHVRRLIEAYGVVAGHRPTRTDPLDGESDQPPAGQHRDATVAEGPDDLAGGSPADLDADTLSFDCPSDEAFAALLDVAHRVGDVTYVDRHAALFEALLRTTDGATVSLVVSLQGRADRTDAFFTLEALDVRDRASVPSVGSVVSLFAAELT